MGVMQAIRNPDLTGPKTHTGFQASYEVESESWGL
jgi:hypothetical protein